jgi:signal transduction histidine kinase
VPDRDDEVARLGVTLNEMLDRMQASFEREHRLLNDAAHELRTPLAILKAEVDLALDRARTVDELTAALASVAEETDHIVRLAQDLLVLARADGAGTSAKQVETSLAVLVQRAADHHEATARSQGVRLEVRASEGSAFVDPLRLRQALDNLIDNALRHTPEGGNVIIAVHRDPGAIRISVEDSGVGFPEGFLDRAFVPFSRGPSAEQHDGAGLGLAIVRAIAEGHGGSAHAANLPTRGAAVVLSFPMLCDGMR